MAEFNIKRVASIPVVYVFQPLDSAVIIKYLEIRLLIIPFADF